MYIQIGFQIDFKLDLWFAVLNSHRHGSLVGTDSKTRLIVFPLKSDARETFFSSERNFWNFQIESIFWEALFRTVPENPHKG